jgi:hypothetical protein
MTLTLTTTAYPIVKILMPTTTVFQAPPILTPHYRFGLSQAGPSLVAGPMDDFQFKKIWT